MARVSVLIPGFRSTSTLGTCLEHIARQTHTDIEVIVVESGPDGLGRSAVKEKLPRAKYLALEKRALPHQSLNRGVDMAEGEVLAFTDADAYPAPDWIERLLSAFSDRGPVVYGGVGLYGSGWVAEGSHLCKFDKWLPAGEPRSIEEGPTVNMMIARSTFEEVGPFSEGTMHADTDLSWRLRRAGHTLWLEPAAIVLHHHLHSVESLVAERYGRGQSFARFERRWIRRDGLKATSRAAAGLLPLRLVTQLIRVGGNAARAGMTASFLRSLPVVAAGLYAWLAGEALALALRGEQRRDAT